MAAVLRTIRRNRPRNGFRQVAIVVGVGTVLVTGGFFFQQQYLPDPGKTASSRDSAKVASTGSGGAAYTGSILYLPSEGSNCRQLSFDNRNGRFTDNGYIDCAKASEQSGISSPKQWSAARAKVISSGFRDR